MRADGWGLHGARRILLHGVTGSGKTTLAARLGALTGLPWTESDSVTWQPGWVQLPEAEQRHRIAELCARDSWILDSAYGSWVDVVLPRTQLVVALDHPRSLSLARLVRRTVTRNLRGTRVCNGNVESWGRTFSRESIVRWHFQSFEHKRARMLAWEADPAAPPVLRLRSPAELEAWLATVEQQRHERSR